MLKTDSYIYQIHFIPTQSKVRVWVLILPTYMYIHVPTWIIQLGTN